MNQITKVQLTRQDVADCEHCLKMIDRSAEGFVIWLKYVEIMHTRSLWQLHWDSWEAFCEEKLEKTVRQVQQNLADHAVIKLLEAKAGRAPPSNDTLATHSQHSVRALRRLPASERAGVLAEATTAAGGKTPTGPQVKAMVDRHFWWHGRGSPGHRRPWIAYQGSAVSGGLHSCQGIRRREALRRAPEWPCAAIAQWAGRWLAR